MNTPYVPKTDTELSAAAARWLATIPRDVWPLELGKQFPRIVNRFATLWPNTQDTLRYFDDLLLDNRGGRQGFPFKIVTELGALKHYYESLQNARSWHKAWDAELRVEKPRVDESIPYLK